MTKLKRNLLVSAAVVALLVSAGYLAGEIWKSQAGLPSLAGQSEGPPGMGGPPREARDGGRLAAFGRSGPFGQGPLFNEEERLKMAKDLGLSQEQQDKIQAIMSQGEPKGPEDMRERMRAMRDVLTPEQRAQAAKQMPQRMMARIAERKAEAKKKLSPQDYEAFEKRLDARMEERRRQFAEGGGPPGFGGGGGSRSREGGQQRQP